ncbi:uncharacterized protein LOC130899046 [Diorhabda carinulata]|uniref:uncharacterized protein LOC130899046 n=1 Tax=Diorhabda carinulata TaxID=1163345 RepID=UPI0025A2FE5D|nr:uncharacterized protein LOC130899046 [Diorhabda carinulata]
MPNKVRRNVVSDIFCIFVLFQITDAIIIPLEELPRPAYTSGLKTVIKKNDAPYTLQNYSKVVVHNRPGTPGAQYVVTHTDQIKNVYPVFNAQTYGQRPRYHNILQTQNNTQIDSGELSRTNRTIIKRKIGAKTLDIYTKCPSGATGQFIYSASCNQFLNCWKGRGTVQNCSPGTLFNPKSLECDFPDKVECVTGPQANTIGNIRVEKSVQQATCPEGFSGIIPDYFDCSKFINCNNGQENRMDCAPGTLFDMNKNMCDYPDQAACFNGENSLDVRTKQFYSNINGQYDQKTKNNHNINDVSYNHLGHGQTSAVNQIYQDSSSSRQDSGIKNGRAQGCEPATQNCGQFSQYNPTYHQGHKYAYGGSRSDVRRNQTHYTTQGCDPATQNCGQFSQYNPTYDQGGQYANSAYGGSRSDVRRNQTHYTTQGCDPATQNCGQFSQYNPTYDQGGQYANSAYGGSRSDVRRNQTHYTTQGCDPATQNCGQFSLYKPTYDQEQNQYINSVYGGSRSDVRRNQTHYTTQGCDPATQNCGQFTLYKPTHNQDQNQYLDSAHGSSGSNRETGGQSYMVAQRCNPAIEDCSRFQNPAHEVHTQRCDPKTQNCGHYQFQYQGETGTDLSRGQTQIVSHRCSPGDKNCGQRQNQYFGHSQRCNPSMQNCAYQPSTGQNIHHSDSTQSGQNGGQFNCDLSKPNCGQDQQPNYVKVCNVNDPNCRQTKKPITNTEPVCPNGSVGLHNHPTDCKKYLSCASGQTYVMDCAPGTLFNEKTGMCDFPSNVKCEVTTDEDATDPSETVDNDHWQTQYKNNAREFGQNSGHGNFRYTTEVYNQESSDNKDQQIITDSNRGNSGFLQRPTLKQTSLDYDDVYSPDNHITATTPRSAWPPPFKTKDSNDLEYVDYVFTYDNGEPVDLEPENVIKVKQRLSKTCDDEDDDFHCTSQMCISLTMLCDGVKDCSDGKDELNCQEYTERFIITKNSKLVVPEKQRYINITHSTCAVLCIQNQKFVCRSFTYRRPDRTCFLSDQNIGMSGALQAHHSSDYYELSAGSIDCSDTTKYFECNNKKCLVKDHLCDGYTDCEDREDEKYCGADKFGYTIRLAGSGEKNEGRVEVTAFNTTGYICDDDFSIIDANVICRELGFTLGAAEIKSQSYFAKDLKESNTLYMIDDLNCLGNETSLIDCSFPGWGIHNCRDQEIAGVVCKTPQEKCGNDAWKCDSGNECIPFDFVCDGVEDCADDSDEDIKHCEAPTELRLVGGSYPGEGRLEIKHNGIWGTVCDDDFNEDAAKVVCKILGYKGMSSVKKDGYYGAGYGPIWLDQVSCYGNETELNKCTHWNWGEHNCEHNEDVGIICSQDAGEVKIERHSNLPAHIEEGLPRNCGFRKDNQFAINDLIHARVIGGGVAKKGDYPWQAALKVRVKDKSAHWCGAIIISSRWVLTAAHCLQGYTKGAYIIVAGDYNTNEDEGTEQKKYIDEFFIHEKFRKGHKMNNDIALIKVKGIGFELNDNVQPICLADDDTDYNRPLNCTISGFGSTKSGSSSYSHNLLAAWIPVHSQDICTMPHVYGDILTDGMVCAGSMDGSLDACDGDSGGPLACLDQGVFTLYGITSWGQHCGYANKPGVYVKVGKYRKWIEDIVAKHSN